MAIQWFDRLPSGWISKRLKFIAPLRISRMAGSSGEPEYIGLENIESWTGRYVPETPTTVIGNDEITALGTSNCFSEGDILFGKLRPYLAKALLAKHDGICSTELLVLQPCAELDARFLLYILLCPEFITLIDSSTFGAKMPRANWDFIGAAHMPLPQVAEQRRIADYLDTETAQIDALMAEKEHMLALLEEKRAALISRAVTRGLNPNVPMKPSGLEWLGDIPAHWEVKRSKRVLKERDERSETGNEELLTVSHITGVTKRSEKDVNMFEAETTEGYKLCSPGNLVINTLWAWMGAMGIANENGIVSPAYHVYELSSELLPSYVDALVRMSIFAKEVTRFSKGVWSSRLRLYPEGLYEVWLPVPPLKEQKEIVTTIAREREKTAGFESALKHSIALLKERRSALITAAVTGQLSLND
ncbi:MAG: restriction endonuclease subunit S [Candidatus Contendobacter sp.]